MRSMYGITRGPRGWKVQLKRSGVTLFRQFGFKMHQGEAIALLRAQGWRDQMVKKHPPVPRRKRADVLRRNNKTGIPGVTCQLGPDGKPRAWTARTYLGPGEIANKYFSVGRYGLEAKLLAIAERQAQLRRMSGLACPHPDEADLRLAPPRSLPSDGLAPVTAREIVRSNNKSGVAGVAYRRQHPGDPGRWTATTRARDGKHLRLSYSVREHGEEAAKALAIAARQDQLRQMAAKAKRRPAEQASACPEGSNSAKAAASDNPTNDGTRDL